MFLLAADKRLDHTCLRHGHWARMRSTFGWIVLLVAACVSAHPASAASKRIALVIGNGAYENLPYLKNTAKDAALLSKALKKANFEVTTLVESDLRLMRRGFLALPVRSKAMSKSLSYFTRDTVFRWTRIT